MCVCVGYLKRVKNSRKIIEFRGDRVILTYLIDNIFNQNIINYHYLYMKIITCHPNRLAKNKTILFYHFQNRAQHTVKSETIQPAGMRT